MRINLVRGHIIKSIGLLLVLLLLAVTGASYLFYQQLQAPINLLQESLIEIKVGDSGNRVLSRLHKLGIIDKTMAYKVLLKVSPQYAKVKAGTYELTPGLTGFDLFALLSSGQEKQFSIALVEGLRWRDWLVQLKTHPFLQHEQEWQDETLLETLHPQGNSLEGWLLPDTYHFTASTQLEDIVLRAHVAMQDYLQQAWENRAVGLPFETPYEALIMASIIEKETGVPTERPLIAAVFINRLEKNMRLQTDPTVIYGMGEDFDGDIRRKDLSTPTAYNTYVIKGLPPTPIAMPGKLSIDAALHPEETDVLYFVAKGDGSHQFSRTLNEHNLAVRQYQLKK
jgi:UPF0755 protein